jgi:hypothetical protein
MIRNGVTGRPISSPRRRRRGPLIINPVIYAEVSAGFDRIEDLDDALPTTYYRRLPLRSRRRFWPASAS